MRGFVAACLLILTGPAWADTGIPAPEEVFGHRVGAVLLDGVDVLRRRGQESVGTSPLRRRALCARRRRGLGASSEASPILERPADLGHGRFCDAVEEHFEQTASKTTSFAHMSPRKLTHS